MEGANMIFKSNVIQYLRLKFTLNLHSTDEYQTTGLLIVYR